MEEVPIPHPETTDPLPELTPDPEKLGRVVGLEFEAAPSEPPPIIFPQAAERDPKLLISRKKLRAKIDSYKTQKQEKAPEVAITTEAETEPDKGVELSEVQLDRRHEAIDEKTKTTRMAEGMVAIGEVLKESPASPGTLVKELTTPQVVPQASLPPVQRSQLTTNYKKPLLFGLVAGALTAIVLIFIYFR